MRALKKTASSGERFGRFVAKEFHRRRSYWVPERMRRPDESSRLVAVSYDIWLAVRVMATTPDVEVSTEFKDAYAGAMMAALIRGLRGGPKREAALRDTMSRTHQIWTDLWCGDQKMRYLQVLGHLHLAICGESAPADFIVSRAVASQQKSEAIRGILYVGMVERADELMDELGRRPRRVGRL